ncbi:hypothetical protein I4436_06015 [Pseudomonas qingdaonensis]|uniref:hypothetical protein n=1 Tax=Pseudomonas TaxID=286 RepID=UPI00143D295C|nr:MULTISPECIES: hypothetical protein [Pseudomonas]MBG8559163.1 hypothetical protein [Pseudomonas qingdaonensis]
MDKFGLLFALIVGIAIGWSWAHHTVATECERLGKFYVGKRTFKCVKVEEVEP